MALVKLNNRGVRSATTFGSISALGEMRFIKKQTASSSATISFVDGSSDVVLDDTYKEYLFTFNNIHPSGDQIFQFQGSTDTGGSYGVTVTTTILIASHDEGNGTSSLAYEAGHDIAQSTGFQRLCKPSNTAADNNAAGYLHLFNPSGTVGVKHFLADTNSTNDDTYSNREIVGGYFNTTSAIDAIQFKMASGDIDAGDICLFGIN